MAWDRPFLPDERSRYISPDGRTELELVSVYDPRDIHESGGNFLPIVYDIERENTVLDLTHLLDWCPWRWEGESVLRLDIRKIGIRIDVPGGTYATSRDGWKLRPLADALHQVPALIDPPPTAFIAAANRIGDKFYIATTAIKALISGVFLFIVLPVILGLALWIKIQDWNRADLPRGVEQRINGWVVRCPWDKRIIPLSLDANGKLKAPAWLSPEPLAPVARVDGLYKAGKVTIHIIGRDVSISRGTTTRGCEAAGTTD